MDSERPVRFWLRASKKRILRSCLPQDDTHLLRGGLGGALLAGALDVALRAVGHAARASLIVAGHFAQTFFDFALNLVGRAFDFALPFGGVMLGAAFGLRFSVAGQLANAFFDVALGLIHSLAHGGVTSRTIALAVAARVRYSLARTGPPVCDACSARSTSSRRSSPTSRPLASETRTRRESFFCMWCAMACTLT